MPQHRHQPPRVACTRLQTRHETLRERRGGAGNVSVNSGEIDEYVVVVVSKVWDGGAEGCLMGGVLLEEHVNDGSISV